MNADVVDASTGAEGAATADPGADPTGVGTESGFSGSLATPRSGSELSGGLEAGSRSFTELQMVVDTALLIGLLAVGDRVATLRLLREQHHVSLTEGRRALVDAGLFLELVRSCAVGLPRPAYDFGICCCQLVCCPCCISSTRVAD
jgi:hypothetical protein